MEGDGHSIGSQVSRLTIYFLWEVDPMKSRSDELLDRAKSAMIAAVEIYNKPDFPYRAESFAILATNGWELLLKARWLSLHQNRVNSLYIYERRTNRDGKNSKRKYIRTNRTNTPHTYGLDSLARKLVNLNDLNSKVLANLEAMVDVRDSVTHFYNPSKVLQTRLYQFSAACVRNFATVIHIWFGHEMTELDLHLMPLSFMEMPSNAKGIVLNADERNFLSYLDRYSTGDIETDSPYSVAIDIDIRFTRSNSTEALLARITTNPKATEIQLTEEQIRDRYPWTYRMLTGECRERYSDFKENSDYHDVRKKLESNTRFALVRYLDPEKKTGTKRVFFNPAILSVFDKHYQMREVAV